MFTPIYNVTPTPSNAPSTASTVHTAPCAKPLDITCCLTPLCAQIDPLYHRHKLRRSYRCALVAFSAQKPSLEQSAPHPHPAVPPTILNHPLPSLSFSFSARNASKSTGIALAATAPCLSDVSHFPVSKVPVDDHCGYSHNVTISTGPKNLYSLWLHTHAHPYLPTSLLFLWRYLGVEGVVAGPGEWVDLGQRGEL